MTVAAQKGSVLHSLLLKHPRIENVQDSQEKGLTFVTERARKVQVGEPNMELSGLVEIMDNNPLVCSDSMSVPDPVSTLGLIALAPLMRAGLLLEAPIVQTNAPGAGEGFWGCAGYSGHVVINHEEQESGGVYACTAFAEITNLDNWKQIDELYDECYGGSFFVHELPADSGWSADAVRNTPHSYYRLRLTPGDDRSLLVIQVMADKDGKCGATQVIHAMNVMEGFEENLGIPDHLVAI